MNVSAGFVNPIQITSTAQGSQDKIVFPVSPQESFYAHYKYVKGVPANSQQSTVPLKKLELINNMIHSLNHLREISSRHPVSEENFGALGDDTIKAVGRELRTEVMKQAPRFTNSILSFASTGMAFTVKA